MTSFPQARWQPAVQVLPGVPTPGALRGEASGNGIGQHGTRGQSHLHGSRALAD